jgi:hypothetical protein
MSDRRNYQRAGVFEPNESPIKQMVNGPVEIPEPSKLFRNRKRWRVFFVAAALAPNDQSSLMHRLRLQ